MKHYLGLIGMVKEKIGEMKQDFCQIGNLFESVASRRGLALLGELVAASILFKADFAANFRHQLRMFQ